MKFLKIVIITTIISGTAFFGQGAKAQLILENVNGDGILSFFTDQRNRISNISVNSANKSLALDYYYGLRDTSKSTTIDFLNLQVKGKATNDISEIISNGKINTGIEFKGGYLRHDLFTNINSNFSDFFTFDIGLNTASFEFFDSDINFEEQFSKKQYRGVSTDISYALFWNGTNRDPMLSFNFSYLKDNNVSKLSSLTIQTTDTLSKSLQETRQKISSKTALSGDYKEFDSYSIALSLSFIPQADSTAKSDGFTLFLSRTFNEIQHKVDLGLVYYLTKQDKKGLRTPIVGLILQANDMFDETGRGNTLDKRLTFSVTSTINLNSLF